MSGSAAPGGAPAPVAAQPIMGDIPLAVIGMSCRVGSVVGYDELWQLLVGEKETHGEVPFKRWSRAYHHATAPNETPPPGRSNTRHAHFLSDTPRSSFSAFDAALFGLSGKEAADVDPQQRLFMELAWECFEDSRVPFEALRGSATGVFVGVMNNDYSFGSSTSFSPYSSTGLANSIASNRLSYLFDLRGPSQTLDTACSSSLVCLHNASRALRAGEIDMALIGGGNIMCNPRVPLALSAMRLLSSDGRSKAFDKSGDGYARAEGGGMLLLKRLDAALRDGDRIHAVIKSSNVNSDGRAQVPIVAPDVRSQMALLTRAYAQAGIKPEDVEYVEAHGTGTALGDAVEANALFNFFLNKNQFIKYGEKAPPASDARVVRIGSIKSNIGHLEAGAGSLGLIKAILCLKKKQLVRSLHFNSFPSLFNGDPQRLRVQQGFEEWKHDDKGGKQPLRVAGVSSFGYGGTNAHVVVQEFVEAEFAPEAKQQQAVVPVTAAKALSPESSPPLLLLLSAHTPQALRQLASSYATVLANTSDLLTAHQLCSAASSSRGLLGFRLTGVARSHVVLAASLQAFADHPAEDGERAAAAVTSRAPAECRLRFQRAARGSTTFVSVGASTYGLEQAHARRIVFVFAGQGSQWRAGVPATLMNQFPAFASILRRIDAFCQATHGWSVLEFLLIPAGSTAAAHQARRIEMEKQDGAVAGVGIFAAEAALAMQLREWGVHADLSLSHSLGEFAASFYSGALSLHEACRMVCTISRMVGAKAPRGHLVDCRIGPDEIQAIITRCGLQKQVYLAAKNAPYSVTLAGTDEGLEALQAAVRASHGAAKAQRLLQRVSSASAIPYHSPLLDEVPGLRTEVIAALDAILTQPAPKLAAGLEDLRLNPSTAHGQVLSTGILVGEEALRSIRNGTRWWRNIAQPVDFIASVQRAAEWLKASPSVHVLDLSPTPVLAANVQAILETQGALAAAAGGAAADAAPAQPHLHIDDVQVTGVLARPDSALFDLQLVEAVAVLLLAGQPFPWANEFGRLTHVSPVVARRQLCAVPLPPLPTQRLPYWTETVDAFRSRMMVWRNPENPPALSVLNGLFQLLPESAKDQHDASLTAVYTATVQPIHWPLIRAHVFQDSALLPASFSVELFTAIGRHIAETHPFVLEDLHWERALWMELQEGMTYHLRVEVKPLDEVSFTLALLARQVSEDKYASPAPLVRHVRGILKMQDPSYPVPAPVFSETLRKAMATFDASPDGKFKADESYPLAWSHDSWYSSFREAGFAYGDCFTLVDGVCANRKLQTAMVRVVIPAAVVADAAKQGYWMHPGVIDAVTQGIAGATSSTLNISASLPIQCAQVTIRRNLFAEAAASIKAGRAAQPVTLWAEVLNGGSEGVDDFADVLVFTPQGEYVGTFQTFKSRGMGSTDEEKHALVEQCYFEWQWKEMPQAADAKAKTANSHIVLLHASEQAPSPTVLAEAFGPSVRAHRWVGADGESRALPAHLLQGVPAGTTVQIVVLMGADHSAPGQSSEAQYDRVARNASWMLTILQMLKELVASWSGGISLTVLSPCCLGAALAAPLSAADEAAVKIDLSTAALPGMLQVWQAECSSVTARLLCGDAWERSLLDASSAAQTSNIRAILRAEVQSTEQPIQDILLFLRSGSDDTVRKFAAQRDAIQLPTPASTAEAEASAIAADGGKRLHVFLMAGGNGSLGVELASKLCESLPREHCLVVFASRRGAFQSAEDEALAASKLSGVRYQSVACNISEPGAAAALLASVQKDAQSRGYASVSVHMLNMAMVLRDALLEKLSAVQIDEVLRPKVLGSLRLLEASQALLAADPKQRGAADIDVRIESLTLFSSSTAFLGNIGQLAYGAANSFLDSLAVQSHHQMQRSSQHQIPVYAFNFPPIAGAGFLATNNKVAAALDHAGYIPLTAREVHRAVRDLTSQASQESAGSILQAGPTGHASVGCIRIRPVPYLHQQPHIKSLFSWNKVLARWKQESVRLPPAQLQQLFGGGATAAVGVLDAAAVQQLVAGMVADVQGLPSLSPAQLRATLSELGIDSQGVTLLNNHFKSAFQVTLPISALLDPASTIPYVSKLLSEKMQTRAGAARTDNNEAAGEASASASSSASSPPAGSPTAAAAVVPAAHAADTLSEQPPFVWLLSGSTPQALQHELSEIEGRVRTWDSGVAGFVQAAEMEQTLAASYLPDHACRRTLVASLAQLPAGVEKLLAELGGASASGEAKHSVGVRFVFLFPGQGSEFAGMIEPWCESCVPFRKAIEHCCRILADHWATWTKDVEGTVLIAGMTPRAVQDMLFPSKPKGDAPQPVHAGSAMVQLALFVFSSSLARVLMDVGIQPSLMLGHSLGEIVAATTAGVMSLTDALRAVWVRGRVMERAPLGAMLAVRASESRVRELMQLAGVTSTDLQIAAINGPQQTVLAGLGEVVDRFAEVLKQQKIPCSRLANKHAFHTPAMAPSAALLERHLATIKLSPPRVPYLSNVTGGLAGAAEVTQPGYYSQHMTQAVQFHRSVLELVSIGAQSDEKVVLLELGPGSTLTKLLRTEPSAAAALDEGRWAAQASCEKPTGNSPPLDSFNILSKVLSLAVQAGLPVKKVDRLLQRPICGKLLQLSYPQQRLWINAALNGALTFARAEQGMRRKLSASSQPIMLESDDRSLAYITSGTYRLRGELLSAADLQQAIGMLVKAHAILRTSFAYDADGSPIQRIHASHGYERDALQENDELRHVSLEQESSWAKVWEVLRVESGRPFPLDRAPLFRVTLLQLADGQILHFTFQHLIMDFAAGTVFGAELFHALQLMGKPGAAAGFLPPPPRSSLDIAWQQKELIASEAGEKRLAYWLAKLDKSGATLPHEVSAAALQPEQAAARNIEVQLTPQEVAQLQQVAARHNSLPSTLLLALATSVLYDQASGAGDGAAADVRVGLVHRPSSVRGADRVIGCLFDILVLSQSMDAHSAQQLPALMEQWENTKAEAVQQAYPLTEMLRRMRSEQQQQQARGATGAPRPTASAASLWQHDLFQLLYNFRSLSGGAYEAQSFEGTSIGLVRHNHWREAQFPLQLDIDWPLGAHATGQGAGPDTPATISLSFDATISTEVAQRFFDAYLARIKSHVEVAHAPIRPRALSISTELTFAPSAAAMAVVAAASSSAPVDLVPQLAPPALTSEIFVASKSASSVVDLLSSAMRRWPNAVAVEGNTLLQGSLTLTYRQLDRVSDAFARRLLENKVAAPVIGLALPRSVEMVVAALGALKAGRCYAPLDPEFFPSERMHRAITSTDMRILVQAPRVEQQVRQLWKDPPTSLQFLEFGLDEAAVAEAMKAPALQTVPLTRQSRAYVEFTSGSTGVPKAVPVSHGNMLSLIPDMIERFEFSAESRTLLFHSFSFDLHVWEVYGSLCVGARLIVLPSVRDVEHIWQSCQKHRITHISMTPSAFGWFTRHHAGQAKTALSVRQPQAAIAQELLPTLRMIMLCGERLQFATLSVWFQTYERLQIRAPRVINSYGITETTVISTFREVTAVDVEDGPLSPPGGNPLNSRPSWIGLPFSNQRFFVLDAESMTPVAAGQPGELFISGEAVAEGYLNAKSELAFLPVRLGWLDGGRETILYRTGDLVVFDASRRDLSFISRVDKTQLKISGIRIEPMEIESVLVAMSDLLLAAVVSAIESPLSGGMLLVAYLQLVDPSNATAVLTELRSRLQQSMPLSLQPRLVVMAQLPTLANMKADRVKLSKWETLQAAESVPPPTKSPSVADTTDTSSVGSSPIASSSASSSPPPVVESPTSPTDASASVFLSPNLVRDSVEIALHVVYRSVLGDSFDPAARLFDDLGLPSMAATRLINLINDSFHCSLPGSVLWSHQTLYAMATLLRQNHFLRPAELLLPLSQRATERDDSWTEESDAPGVALVLVYSAGGGAVHYLAFAKSISLALPSLAIFALERAEGAPERQLESSAQEISQRLAGVPVVLCGFSSGGSIAYELGQILPSMDVPVQAVVMLDTPHTPTIVQPGYVLGNLMRTTLERSAIASKKAFSLEELEQRVATFRSTIYRMLESPDEKVLDHVYELAASQFSIEPFKQPTFLRSFVETSQADCEYVKQHIHPRHTALADRQLPVHYLAAVLESDPTLGLSAAHVWRERSASKNFVIKHINVDHQKLLMHPDTRQAVVDATMPYRTAQTSMPLRKIASPAPSPVAAVTSPAPKAFSLESPSSPPARSPSVASTSSYVMQSPVSLPAEFSPMATPRMMSPSPSLPVSHASYVDAAASSGEGESLHVRHVPSIKTVHMPAVVVGLTPAKMKRELHSLLSSMPAVRRLVSSSQTPAGLMSAFQAAVPFSMKESANSELFHDNLDTGNSCMEPFESVQAAMTMTTANDMRRYQPPEPTAELRASVLGMMQRLGLLTPPARGGVSNAFDVVVGPGTSFFMHSLCSLLVQRPLDAVLLPTPGYGLFMPAVEEVGGQIAFVHIDERTNYRLTPEELQRAVRDTNQRLMDTWLATLPEDLMLMRRRLIRAGLLEDKKASADWSQVAEDAVHAEIAAAGPLAHAQGVADRVDRVLRRFVHVELLGGVPARLSVLESLRAIVPSPPRCVAYLHVNPDTFGRCYGADECRPLAQVMADANVAVIEDLAYAMVQHDLQAHGAFRLKSASFLEAEHWESAPAAVVPAPGAFKPRPLSSLRVYCMLGFSKGFSMAGLRLGCLVCPTSLAPPIFTRVFTSVGFVASSLQRALHHLCRALPQQLHTYLARNAVEWTLRRTVFLALVQGTDQLQHTSDLTVASLDLLRPLLTESCAAIWDSLESFRPWHSPEEMSASMLSRGLRDYFRVCIVPEAGFFCLLDATGLMARSAGWSRSSGEKLSSALEVCVFLKTVCGVKTIPEEALGLPLTLEHGRRAYDATGTSAGNHAGRTATLLRFSFSVSLPRLVQLITQMHVQLARLEMLNDATKLKA